MPNCNNSLAIFDVCSPGTTNNNQQRDALFIYDLFVYAESVHARDSTPNK